MPPVLGLLGPGLDISAPERFGFISTDCLQLRRAILPGIECGLGKCCELHQNMKLVEISMI